jgi:hypothetical protein
MTVDDPFPPVDPIVPTPPTHRVVPRQRRFSDKTRRLINELRQEQKELAEQGPKNPEKKSGSNEPPPKPSDSKGIDTLA